MKSLVSRLHKVAEGFLTDFSQAYPDLSGEFLRDKQKLATHVRNRGVGFFTLDLPSLDSALTSGLEEGRLALGMPLSKRVSKRVRVPAFMRGLWLRIFLNDGTLRQDPDPTAVFFLRSFFAFGKKITLTCTPARNAEAIKEFVDVERKLPKPTLEWDSDSSFDGGSVRAVRFASGMFKYHSTSLHPAFIEDDRDRLRREDTHLLQRLDSICRDAAARLGMFDPVVYETTREITQRPAGAKNGPGAVSDLSRMEEKYFFENWPAKLGRIFPHHFFGQLPSRIGLDFPRNLEHPSKLILVPKTAKTPRLIASEPSYHQWCQQLMKEFFVDGIKTVFKGDIISFDDQSKSHPLVHRASLDGSFATIDLSSASDRLSCRLVERAFRTNLSVLNAMHACRTRVISGSKKAPIEFAFLRKFSTMGSALTFPVQSFVFACIALASLPGEANLDSQLARYRGRVRVFGDDIIVPKEGYADLCRLLEILDLRVNKAKSFVRGRFRESCGFDAFLGYDVTPVKPQLLDPTTPDGRQSMIDTSNNLFSKGLWNTSRVLLSLLPDVTLRHLPVKGPHQGSVGLSSFCGSDYSHLSSRWNSRLHRTEVRCTSYISRALTTFTDGKDYLFQALHNLHRKIPIEGIPEDEKSLVSLGRVVKAVTRERRSWVDILALKTV